MAAKAIGMSDGRILLHHVVPNSLAPIIVQGTLAIATAIIEAAALGFLGMGAQPPMPEWGKMLADSRQYIIQAPWTVIFPGLAIMLTVLGLMSHLEKRQISQILKAVVHSFMAVQQILFHWTQAQSQTVNQSA